MFGLPSERGGFSENNRAPRGERNRNSRNRECTQLAVGQHRWQKREELPRSKRSRGERRKHCLWIKSPNAKNCHRGWHVVHWSVLVGSWACRPGLPISSLAKLRAMAPACVPACLEIDRRASCSSDGNVLKRLVVGYSICRLVE